MLIFWSTVVPALGDPHRERPPDVCGHFVNVPTHFKVKLPVISGHLPNADADSHLLVVSTCYNGQCKQMPRFRWSFQPKIAGAHPNLRPTDLSNFRAVVWWLWQCVYSLGISLVVIVLCSIARCIIFGVNRLPVRPCDGRPPAMYGHFCLVPRVSVHDRYYCTYTMCIAKSCWLLWFECSVHVRDEFPKKNLDGVGGWAEWALSNFFWIFWIFFNFAKRLRPYIVVIIKPESN